MFAALQKMGTIFSLIAPFFAIIVGVWHISDMYHAIDTRMDHLESKMDNILYQVQASNQLITAQFSGRVDVLTQQIKDCGCSEVPAHKTQTT